MPVEILMPALSPTMEEGTLARWLVSEGDQVAAGDVIAEIETDKATMEFEAVEDGVMGRILIPQGTIGVAVNTPIALLLEEGETSADTPAPSASAVLAAPVTTARHDSPDARKVERQIGARVFASPLARRIARQNNLDLTQISGSGPHGRIVKADVEAALANPQGTSPADDASAGARMDQTSGAQLTPATARSSASAVAALYADRNFTEIALDGMRRTVAARLTEAKQTIPHFYLRRDIRLDALLDFRRDLNRQMEKRGLKLSINDFIIKACALALQEVPAANAVWAGDRILQMVASDVAVAVAVDGGLFTPVLRDAETRSLSALSIEMKDLATRARDRKLAPQDYQGGSFAISNLGMFGIDNFDAVINPPHGAILAVGAGVQRAVVTPDGTLGIATVMSVTLSVDHRVIDGALGAQLLGAIVDNLENPMAMLA